MLDLRNCDCMEYLKTLKDNEYELAICDVPYGINFAKKRTGPGWVERESKEWDKERPNADYFNEIFRVSKNQIFWGSNYLTNFLPPSQGWIFWDKGQRDFSLADGELAYTSFNRALRVFRFTRGQMQAEYNGTKFHPTTKPVALYKWLLQNYAKPGDKILDTHGGSMSIAIACADMQFDLTCCELDTDYFNQAVDHVKKHVSQLDMFIPTPEIKITV